MPDTARHGALQHDIDGRRHIMSISLVATELEAAGVPRSHRHIIRLCKAGSFDAGKYLGATGDEWFVAPDSVPKVIGDLRAIEEARARRGATQPATSEHVVVEGKPQFESDTARHGAPQPATSGSQQSQEGSETQPATSRYVQQLEKRIEEKDDVITLLKGQLKAKDEQITRHSERERETNLLIRGLQNLVLRLQPGRPANADVFDGDPLMRTPEGEAAAQ